MKSKTVLRFAAFFFALLSFSPFSHGETDSKLLYPELHVTPLASERLEFEARDEMSDRWTRHLPIQIPAALLVATSFMQMGNQKALVAPGPEASIDDQNEYDNDVMMRDWAAPVGLAIGLGWLATTFALSYDYFPYRSAWREIRRKPKGTTQEKLLRERLSEEALKAPSELGTKLRWLSTISQAIAMIYVSNQGGDNTRFLGAISAISLTTPFIFENRWNVVFEYHEDYKQRIYSPINGIAPPAPKPGSPPASPQPPTKKTEVTKTAFLGLRWNL